MRILSGWKEIAAYLSLGIRTVQRWESLGMPVHRPQGVSRKHVIALTHELDQWLSATPTRSSGAAANVGISQEELLGRIRQLEMENAALRKQLSDLNARTFVRAVAAKAN